MVVSAILGLALALPTGALFGVGYGTGVRIGYEQVYPLLFPVKEKGDTSNTVTQIKSLNQIYDAIGGKEASQMGIANGIIQRAVGDLKDNPDFLALGELASNASGVTPLNLTLAKILDIQNKSLQELEYRNRYGIDLTVHLTQDDVPGGILEHPLNPPGGPPPPDQGPEQPTDKFGYGTMTRTELLADQPAFMQPRPANFVERVTNWNFWYDKNFGTTPKTPAPPPKDNFFNQSTEPMKKYLQERGRLIGVILQTKVTLNGYRTALKQDYNQTTSLQIKYKRQITIWEGKVSNARKALMTFITHARNKSATKQQANKDWNLRVWKV